MIKLFKKTETSFETNGIGLLTNYIFEPKVKEERNGYFTFNFKIPLHTKYGVQIAGEMIVTADCPGVGEQPFRITKVTPSMGILSVQANHIFYDLADNFIEDINIVASNGQKAGQHILGNTSFPHNFTFRSDLADNYNCRIVRYNPVEAFLDDSKDNTFVSRWGGEIKRDKYEIIMNNMRGTDRGVRISDRKNLTGYEADVDFETVVTRIVPMGYDGLMLPETYVDSPLLGQYTHPKIATVTYSQVKAQTESEPKEDELPIEEAYAELRRLATLEFSEHHVDEPKATYKINFVDLSKTTEYENFKTLEEILPWDWITVDHNEDNLHVRARLQAYTWDPLTKRYIDLTLGSVKSTVSGSMGKEVDYQDQIDQIREISDGAVISANGKNTNFYGLFGEDGLGEPTANRVGDIWFKPVDDEIVMKQWDGTIWKDIVDTATDKELTESIEEVGKEVEQAQSDSATALENANDAVNKANEASAKADQSQQTADQAKSDATNAAGKAQSALDSAGQALSTAQQTADDLLALDFGTGNLLRNSTWNYGRDGWVNDFQEGAYLNEPESDKPNSHVLNLVSVIGGVRQFPSDPIWVNAGEDYILDYDLTLPFWTDTRNNVLMCIRIFENKTGSMGAANAIWTPYHRQNEAGATQDDVGKWKRYSWKFTIPEGKSGWLRVFPYWGSIDGESIAKYRELMFTHGNVSVAWEPSQQDIQVQIDNVNGELSQKVSQTTFDQLENTVSQQTTQITQNTNAIKLKADQTTVNSLTGRVSTAEGSITTMAGQIKLKANQTTVDTLAGRVTTAEGSITTLAGQVALKANKTDVDTIAGRVSSAESQLTVQAGKITGLSTLTDGHTTQIGSLQSGYDGLSSTVSKVQTDIDDMEYTNPNLLIDSDVSSLTKVNAPYDRYFSDAGATSITALDFVKVNDAPTPSGWVVQATGDGSGAKDHARGLCWYQGGRVMLEIGETYTMSCLARLTTGKARLRFQYGTSPYFRSNVDVRSTEWEMYSWTFVAQQDSTRIYMPGGSGDVAGTAQMCGFKLEKGNRATPWGLANAELATVTQLSSLTQTVDSIQLSVADKASQSQVTQLSDQITSVVSTVDGHTSQISQLGSDINLRVTQDQVDASILADNQIKDTRDDNQLPSWYYANYPRQTVQEFKRCSSIDLPTTAGNYAHLETEVRWNDKSGGTITQTAKAGDGTYQRKSSGDTVWLAWAKIADSSNVVSQINVSEEGILIAGQKVHITGQTTIDSAVIKTAHIADAAITSAKIGSLSADKITAGTLNGGNVNIINLNADNIVSGTISGQNLSINLTSGEVMFTKGSIRNADATFVMDIVTGVVTSRGTVLSPNSTGDLLPTGFDLMNGKLQFMNGSYGETSVVYGGIDTNTHYGQVLNSSSSWISGNYFSNSPTLVVNSGDQTNSVWQSWKKNVALGTTDFKELPMLSSGVKAGLGLTGSKNAYDQNIIGGSMGIVSNATASVCPDGFAQTKAVIQARNGIYMSSGFHYQLSGNSVSILTPASIRIGDTANDNSAVETSKQSAASIWAQGHTFTFKGDTVRLWANHHRMDGLYSSTKSASANVYLGSDSILYRATSARKYKTAITIADDVIQHAKKVLAINPSSWFDKSDMGTEALERRYGFIADEFDEAGLTEVVVYNKGQIESLAYDRIPMYHNVILNEHEQRIQDLENEVQKLKMEIEGLRAA